MAFNIGDRVVSTVDYNDDNELINIGTTGTVVGYLLDDTVMERVGVEWDVDPEEAYEANMHSCDGRCSVETGWYVYESTLELLCEREEFNPESFESLFGLEGEK